MNAPRRLKDDPAASPELRRLFASAPRARPMTEDQRARVRSRVASIVAAPAAFGVLALALKAAAAGSIVIGAIVAAVYLAPSNDRPTHTAPVRPVPERPVAPVIEETVIEAPAAREPDPPRRVAREAAPRREGLAAEMAMLQRAHAVLERDPRSALAQTRTHQRRFPRGQLAAERELIAAQALRALGNEAAAVRRARGILRDHPGTIAAERARAMIARE